MTVIEAVARFARRATPWDLALRLLVLISPLAVLGIASSLASPGVPGILVVLTVAGAAASAALPNSHAAAVEIVLLAWVWLANVDGGTDGWTLATAIALLGFHTASALAASAPLGGHPERPVLVAVARRAGVVLAITVAVWAVAALLDSRTRSGGAAMYSAALGAVTAVGVVLLVASRTGRSADDR